MVSRTAWRIWAIVLGAVFAVLEGKALRNAYDGDTLSEYVWGWGPWRFVIVGFLIWLTIHFIRRR